MRTEFSGDASVGAAYFLRVLRRWWWLLLTMPIIAGAAAYWYSARQTPVYTATATLFISQASPTLGDVSAAKQLAKTYSELVLSRPVIEQVITDLKLNRSVRQVASQIDVSDVRDTQIINLTTSDSDPQRAADIANSVARTFIVWIAEQQATSLGQNTQTLRNSITEAEADLDRITAELTQIRSQGSDPSPAEAARIDDLEQRSEQYQDRRASLLSLLERAEFAPRNQIVLTTPAEAPRSPSSPNPQRTAAIAFTADLALVLAAVLVIDRLNNRVRLPVDVQRNAQLPVLGVIPRSRRRAGIEILVEPHSLTSESIRTLRTTLQFATQQRGLGALAITSSSADEGKSTIAANLAVAIAQTGQRVVLVDGDLRQPSQHTLFQVKSDYGLSDLLSHPNIPVDKALVDGPVAGLRLLAAGKNPTNPSELLTGQRLKTLLADLKRNADVIIIDTPPLLAISDALLLAGVANNALIIAAAGRTRLEALQGARAVISQTGVNVLGSVLNGTTDTSRIQGYVPYTPDTSTSYQEVR